MTRRIGLLAACASTLVLLQADLAQAGYGALPGSRVPARTAETGPEPAIVLAQSAIVPSRSNIKRPTRAAEANSALGQVSTTRGRKLPLVEPAVGGKPPSRLIGPALGDVNGDGRRNRTTGGTLPQRR
jgi:hypothetical protein